jgi:hypothetical protein
MLILCETVPIDSSLYPRPRPLKEKTLEPGPEVPPAWRAILSAFYHKKTQLSRGILPFADQIG